MKASFYQSVRKLLIGINLIWAGILLGVSFMATPVKFLAPHLSIPMALEVGKATFHLLNTVEWGIFITVIVMTYFTQYMKSNWIMPLVLGAILMCQTFWFLPILDIRVDRVLAGLPLTPAPYHGIYIVTEVLKLFAVLISAWHLLKKE